MTARPDDLLSDLAGSHDFRGAPCVGEYLLMDIGGPAAEALCARCPTTHYRACRALLDTIPVRARSGTWAGRTFTSKMEK